jgi:hypothetical protein
MAHFVKARKSSPEAVFMSIAGHSPYYAVGWQALTKLYEHDNL